MYNGFSPCKECVNRCVGCHSNCLKYVEYHDARQEYLKKRSEKLKNEDIIREYYRNKRNHLRKRGYI